MAQKRSQCWVPLFNCLGQVESIVTQGHGARIYGLSTKDSDYFSNELLSKLKY